MAPDYPLKKDYLRTLYPAQLVAWVAQVTLAKISLMSEDYLRYIGWFDNPVVDILYTMTSAGVWIARTDTSGQVKTVESNSTALSTYANRVVTFLRAAANPSITPQGSGGDAYYTHQIARIPFVSDAGGNPTGDVSLVGATVGYYNVARILAIVSSDAGGALAPVLYFSTTSHDKFLALGFNITDSNYPSTQLADLPVYYIDDDNEALVIDEDSSGLGVSKNWIAIVEYWKET